MLAIPTVGLLGESISACAGAAVVAGPIARYAAQMVLDVFAEKGVDFVLSSDFSPTLVAAKNKLEKAAGALGEVWGAEVSAQPGDVVLAGIHASDPKQGSSLQPFDWQPVTLPLPVQIGLAYHANFLLVTRTDTNWYGWNDLTRPQRLAAVRAELEVVNVSPTDTANLTSDQTYLCTIKGGGPARHNDNIMIEWTPTTETVKQTKLVVRRGNVPDNLDDAVWEPQYDTDPLWMHYEQLWKPAPQ
jgi:hypothetical protein